jgi:hypothetical protein
MIEKVHFLRTTDWRRKSPAQNRKENDNDQSTKIHGRIGDSEGGLEAPNAQDQTR